MPNREVEQALQWELSVLQWRRRLLPLGIPAVSVLVLLTLLVVDLCQSWVGEVWRGERTWAGARRYVPPHEPDPAVFSQVDLELLHERLLPRWGLGLGWGRDSSEEANGFEAAFAEARRDPNLAELLLDLREAARTDAAGHSSRIEYLVWAWNHYLSSLDSPWHLEGNVEVGAGRNHLIIQTYRVRQRAAARVGRRSYPVLFLARADHVNIDDAALGRTGVRDGAAQVLFDGIREHATHHVWPLLHDLSAHCTRTDESFAPAVSSEVRAALAPEHYAVLTRTAPSYRALLLMRESIRQREDCGSRFWLSYPATRGYSAEFQGRLAMVADAEQESSCPAVTLAEAATIEQESAMLAAAPRLEVALEALTQHLTRGVAIHEARHVADEVQVRAFTRPLRCPACPAALSAVARAEVSAYLASFADEHAGVTSLYQACRVATGTSANAIALGYLLPVLLPDGCTEGPPPDIHERARQLEQELFGRATAIELQYD